MCRPILKLLLGVMFCGASLVLANTHVSAAVKLPAVIGDNMVLQRGMPVPIWGWADKGEEVSVTIAGQKQVAKAGDDGRWKVTLDKLDVGQPLEMTVQGSSGGSVTLKNILVGEVWICSGQSNMAIGVVACKNGKEETAAANHPQIRLFTVPLAAAAQPAADVASNWRPCTPENIANGKTDCGGFSAAAYYFGRQLQAELNVPIGLIDTSVGGTPAEFWTSRKALEANPALKSLAQGDSSSLYNGMIAPLIPYAIRGAIWYQGESNSFQGFRYRTLFPAMIANWRTDWGQGDFPFGFVQIAPFEKYTTDMKEDPRAVPELWESQLLTLKSTPNTGMVVTTDIGDLKDIHPQNKQDVGRRLALWALAKVYGRDLVCSGPIYRSLAVEGDKIRLQFDHSGGGLVSRDGRPLCEFTIAGEDQKFLPAVATIDGPSVVVHSDQVPKPAAVRFAWRNDAAPNLSNKDGLPASPFRTDRWHGVTEP
jgi:sialate O-acetylesterase